VTYIATYLNQLAGTERDEVSDAVRALLPGAGEYTTVTEFVASRIPADVTAFSVDGYAAEGDGGAALWVRASVQAAGNGKRQSADGTWWELGETNINARMLGAKGDGIADDTVAIQEALNVGTTGLTRGTYLCGTLVIPNTKYLNFYGVGTASVLKMKPGGKLITWAGNAGAVYYQQGTIRDFLIDGTNGTDHAIDTTGVGGLDITDVYVFNVPVGYNGVYVNGIGAERTHDINIKGPRVYSQTAGNAGIGFGPLASDCNVEEFFMNGNYVVDYCLDFESGATGITVNGGHPYNAAVNVARLTGAQSVLFTGVGLDSSNDNSVEIVGGGHHSFVNCFFQNIETAKIGLNISGSAQFVSVIGGRFQGVGATSAVVADATTNVIRLIGVDVSGQVWTPDFSLAGTTSTIIGGQLLFADGSAAAPAYSFSSDPNTGIWHPAADRVEVVTGGARRMLFADDGRVILGTAGKFQMADGMYVTSGTGTPEGVVTAGKGSLYLRSDGGAGTSMYIKESGTGNTGWVAK
jgi:hypothetical protein